MTLVAIAAPDNESDLAMIACVLEANQIPHFVQGGGFGGLFPGPQINGYNSRRVLVPESCVADALELLSEFDFIGAIPRTPTQSQARDAPRSKAAMFLEMLFMGWFVPARRAAPPDDANDAAVEDDTDPPEKS